MAQARITRLTHSNGTITLEEGKAYTDLSHRDRFVEYDAIAQRMQLVAVKARSNQDLINHIGMLRDNLASAKHNGYANMPAHDEFVTLVNEYNAWVPSQSLHLTPTDDTPVVDPSVPPAPSTTVHETTTVDDTTATTPSPATTTTTVVDDDAVPAWVTHWHTRAVKPLDDAVFGPEGKSNEGLMHRMSAVERHLGRTENGTFATTLAGQSPNYRLGGFVGLIVALALFLILWLNNHTEMLPSMFVGIVAGVGIGALVAWLAAKVWHQETNTTTSTSDNN